MKILGIDTTRRKAKVFLLDTKDKENSLYLDMSENIKHSEGLFLYIQKIFMESKLDIQDVDGFACVVGPGSFTGIRVGMSTIKGFNKVLQKSVVSLNMFEILSQEIKSGLVLLNSTNTSCYYAKVEKNKVVDTGVVDKKSIKDFADNLTIYILEEEQDLIVDEYNNYKLISNLNDLYYSLIISKMNDGNYGEFVPYYLQLSQAERNIKND